MGKPTLGQIAAAVLDPMLSDNFQLNFPSVPTGANSQPLLMQCRTASKPGWTINNVEVQLFGHTLEHAGNLTYGHDLTVEYVENRSAQISKILEDWGHMVRNPETQTGAYKSEYQRDGELTVFDQKGNTIRSYIIHGCWPSQLPDLPFDGQASNIISLSVTFKYDWWEVRGG